MALKKEKKCFASKIIFYIYYLKRICEKNQKILNFNNLVLEKSYKVNSQ